LIILSHRGLWREAADRNTERAFLDSFSRGFGTETDVRDASGLLVISHDVPSGGEIPLVRFLELFQGRDLPLAINIKSDGLADMVSRAMACAGLSNWFVFDMSVPDARAHIRAGNPWFARMSEVEASPPWMESAAGVWLDSFGEEWYDTDLIGNLAASGKQVCLVSSELHGRDPSPLWNRLLAVADTPGLMLCTDNPEKANRFFGDAS
jgi:hypothetical protein